MYSFNSGMESPRQRDKVWGLILADTSKMTGKEKAAILLLSLGEDEASMVMKQLDTSQISQLTNLMARMRQTPSDIVKAIPNRMTAGHHGTSRRRAFHLGIEGQEAYSLVGQFV